MEFDPNKIWNPKEWESHANEFLKIRYNRTDYIPIPDKDGGDGGIEGYSTDGNAYQMYCPEQAVTTGKLYEAQRDKITEDINKFINNTAQMRGFFGHTKIRRWILVTPKHESKKLVQHATKKTKEVIDANLDYVDNSDFRVLIWDYGEFQKEKASLLRSGIAKLKLEERSTYELLPSKYCIPDSEFDDNLTRKLTVLNSDKDVVENGKNRLVKYAIASQNLMNDFKEDYPEYHQKIVTTSTTRAEELDIEALDSDPQTQTIAYQTKTLHTHLVDECHQIHTKNLKTIAQGTVADWLMNCTWDFS